MKKSSHATAFTLTFLTSLIIISGCKPKYNESEYLAMVLNNLEKIKSASYFSTNKGTPPGDTGTLRTYYQFKKEFVNPADTFIGSAFVSFESDDTSKMYSYYDGNVHVYINRDSRTISVDSFKTSSLPFRPIGEPFFHRAKSLIRYALDTNDSTIMHLNDFGDSIKLTLFVPGKIIYFFGKPHVADVPYMSEEEKYSKFEMWINKSNDLPYKMGSKYSFATSIETYSNVEFNGNKLEEFNATRYFPADFTIKERSRNQPTTIDLTGKKAPEWILTDSENNSVALKDLKSKVLIIEFMGIGCGPCHSAIPFLKQLVSDYKISDLELISIETWRQNVDALKKYKDNNNLNHTLLVSTNDVMQNYYAHAVPVFFILDKERVIRKIIRGYGKGSTDQKIQNAINELI